MIQKTYKIWEEHEYTYDKRSEFSPTVTAYLHEDDEADRPALLIVPGGGYYMVCPWEGEPVARAFYQKGFQTFVLTYTTNFLHKTPLGLQALRDISRAVVFLRKNAKELKISSSAIATCGFSAGGHLSGSLTVHHADKQLKENGTYRGISNRPDAAILCYPLITTEEAYTHKECLSNLLGADASEQKLEYMSLEKQIVEDTPPIFIWHTVTDEIVPVENSICFAQACIEKKVPIELHLFSEGPHGMSLAEEDYPAKELTGLYCMEQLFSSLPELIRNGSSVPGLFEYKGQTEDEIDSIKSAYLKNVQKTQAPGKKNKKIAMWSEMAYRWLINCLKI